jgi:hypothetical protein
MSTNRSVQAAQRRRAGPPEPQQYSRGPTTSINSAQMFANQARPGNGPNMPNGRLAGQQAAYSQQQMMQQQYQNQHQEPSEKEGVQGISKMTIAQAVTLITLRLGAVESKLIEMEHIGFTSSTTTSINTSDNTIQIDKSIFNTIMNRLEALEKRSPTPTMGSSSSPDITLLKQQMDTIKPVIVQTKNATVSLLKDNKDLKILSENLKEEVQILRETISNLETLTAIHSEQIKDVVISFSSQSNENFELDSNNIITDEHGIMNASYNPDEFSMNVDLDDLKNIHFADSNIETENVLDGLSVPNYNPNDLTGINFEDEIVAEE